MIVLSPEEKAVVLQGIRNPQDEEKMRLEAEQQAKVKADADAALLAQTGKKIEDGGQQSGEAGKTQAGGSGEENAITEIQKKLEAEQPISAEEQKILDNYLAAPAVKIVDDAPVSIGGVQKLKSEWIPEMVKDLKIANIDLLPAETVESIFSAWNDSKNKAEWQKNLTQKGQDAAAANRQTRAKIGEMTVQLMQAQDNIKGQIQEANGLLVKLQKQAASPITENDVYDEGTGRINFQKQMEYQKKLEAQEMLPELQNKLTKLDEQSVQTGSLLVTQTYRDFIDNNPQYQLSADVVQIANAFENGTINPEDRLKLLEMMDIYREAKALNVSMIDRYGYRVQTNNIAIKPLANNAGLQSSSEALREIEKKNKNKTLLDQIKAKQQMARSAAGGGAGGGGTPEQKSAQRLGAETIRASVNHPYHGSADSAQLADSQKKLGELGY